MLRRGFALSGELPLRGHLFRLAAEEHVFVLLLHHIAGDGWSLGPLSRDLSAFYRARSGGVAAALPGLPVQYADYTLWQQAALGSEADAGSAIARQLSFWSEALRDLPDQLDLPGDRARPAVASHRGGHVRLRIDAELHRGLAGLARGAGASLFMVLQAGLAGLLSRLGAGHDIAIGSPIAGRTDGALDDLIGFFVNTLVLRTDTSGNPGFGELVGRVRGRNLAAYGHQELPFERLVEVLNPARSLSRHPLFQVMLAFEAQGGAPGAGLELAGLRVRPEPIAGASAKFDLSLGLAERRGAHGEPAGIEGVLEYSADLFDAASVTALGARLVRLLAAAVAEPGRALGSLPVLEASERDTILRAWNDTGRELLGHALDHDLDRDLDREPGNERAAATTLPALFAAQAVRTPDAVAVVFEDRQLSYAALEAHANRLAHHLRGLGAGPETVVGLCVERSPEMVIGLLGILKAGAAYLPLDPQYPRERLAFMLADAGAAVLVTPGGAARAAAGSRSPARPRAARRRRTGHRPAARHRAAVRPRSPPPRLCDLHLGIDRHPKRRRRRTSADCCIEPRAGVALRRRPALPQFASTRASTAPLPEHCDHSDGGALILPSEELVGDSPISAMSSKVIIPAPCLRCTAAFAKEITSPDFSSLPAMRCRGRAEATRQFF